MPRATRRRSTTAEAERNIYGQVVAAMNYPEPSTLIHHLDHGRSRRLSPAELVGPWQQAVAATLATGQQAAWNMYVHVPYCKSICTFCNYKRLKVSSREALDQYVAFIENEVQIFAPAFAGVRFGALYVGGGTPSVLAPAQLRRLFSALNDGFAFEQGAQKNFEFDPMVMTEDRFRVVREFGFTRYSFGIQSVDVEVNALHNRGRQQRGHIDKQFRMLAEHGAESMNIDFLLGLAGTDAAQMLAEIEEVLSKHRPNEVTIYFLYPTQAYVAEHFGADYDRFKAHLAPFEQLIPAGLRQLAARIDYRVRGDGNHVITMNNARPEPNATPRPGGPSAGPQAPDQRLHYCDVPSQVHRPLFLLGLGDSARSRIFGRMSYRAEYDSLDPDPHTPRYVAFETTPRDEMFSYLALVFRDGDVMSRALFRRTFGVDLLDVHARQLDKLMSLGVLSVDADSVTFAPQSRRQRLRDLLFFLPAKRRRELVGSLPAALAAERSTAPA